MFFFFLFFRLFHWIFYPFLSDRRCIKVEHWTQKKYWYNRQHCLQFMNTDIDTMICRWTIIQLSRESCLPYYITNWFASGHSVTMSLLVSKWLILYYEHDVLFSLRWNSHISEYHVVLYGVPSYAFVTTTLPHVHTHFHFPFFKSHLMM